MGKGGGGGKGKGGGGGKGGLGGKGAWGGGGRGGWVVGMVPWPPMGSVPEHGASYGRGPDYASGIEKDVNMGFQAALGLCTGKGKVPGENLWG